MRSAKDSLQSCGSRLGRTICVVAMVFAVDLAYAQTKASSRAGKAMRPVATKPIPPKPAAPKGVAKSSSKAAPKTATKAAAKSVVKPDAKSVAKSPVPVFARQAEQKQAKSEDGSWSQQAGSWTRTVRMSDSQQSTTLSETLALAIDTQYLLVPWNFVSTAWLARPGAKFFVDQPNQEAQVVELDLASNLALLKVEQPLIPSYYRGRIRLDSPRAEESLVVLASRDWVRGGAKFLRSKNEGGLMRFQINDGLENSSSARFVFDRSGQLIAVASPSMSEDQTWLSPARTAFEMLRKQDGPRPASAGATSLRRAQLYGWQDRWTLSVSATPGSWSMQSLECKSHLVEVHEKSLASKIQNVRAQTCNNRFPMALGADYTTGIQVLSGDVDLRSDGSNEETATKVAQALSEDLFKGLEKNAAVVNLLSVPECEENRVTNRRGEKVHVRFCTSAIKAEPGLNDTAISVASFDGGSKEYVAVARFRGFGQSNTRRLMEAMIENVRGIR